MTEHEEARARSLVHGHRTLATITDPEGNPVGLASHRH